MGKMNIGLLYLGLHNQLVKKFGEDAIITRKEFFIKIGRFQHLAKNLRPIIIKEMEEKQLIKRLNRDNLQILKIDIDLEKDASKLYELVGLI